MAKSGSTGVRQSTRNLLALVASASVSEAGNWVTFIALNTLIWGETGSPVAVSGLFVAQTLPVLVCGVPAGLLADRVDRRRLMVASDIARGMLVSGMALVLPRISGLTSRLAFAYCVVALLSGVSVLFQVSRTSLTPALVDDNFLLRTNSLMALSADAISVFGPWLAGVTVSTVGATCGLLIDAATFFLSAGLLWTLKSRRTAGEQDQGRLNGAGVSVREALDFLRGNVASQLVILTLVVLMMSGGAINALFVVYASQGLGLDALGYGTLLSSLGVGFVAGSLLMSVVGPRARPERLFLLGIVVAALAPISWAVSPGLSVAAVVSVLNGVGNSMFGVAGDTILQRSVPDRIRGRVLSVGEAAQSVSSLVSMGLAGVLSNMLGVRTVFFLAGLTCVPAIAAAGFLNGLTPEPREPAARP